MISKGQITEFLDDLPLGTLFVTRNEVLRKTGEFEWTRCHPKARPVGTRLVANVINYRVINDLAWCVL